MSSRIKLIQPRLIASCSASGTVLAFSTVATSNSKTTAVVQTVSQTTASKYIMLDLGHPASVLFNHNPAKKLLVFTTGMAPPGTGFTLPIYQIVGWQSPTIDATDPTTYSALTTEGTTLSGAVDDSHALNGSDWTNRVKTEILIQWTTVAAHLPADWESALFGLEVALPYSTSGAAMQIDSIAWVTD